MSVTRVAPPRRELPPVRSRAPWIAWGLTLQVVGVGIPVVTGLRRAHEDGVLGGVSHYTVRLVWHEMLRSDADVALIVLGVVVFAAGAVVLSRPFVRGPATLLIAVPLAAVGGLAALGVLALVVAGVIAAAEGSSDVNWTELLANLPFGQASGRRRRK